MTGKARTMQTILDSLIEQDCRIKKTTSGWLVFFPNGGSTCFHYTPSDTNAIHQQRRDVTRAGLTWPHIK